MGRYDFTGRDRRDVFKDRIKEQESVMPTEVRTELKKEGYICCALLGQGAFSRVYRVMRQDRRIYACKIGSNTEMLKKEAEIMEKLHHPLFPAFFGFQEKQNLGFLIMEYIAGDSLEVLLRRRGRFSAAQVMRTGTELAEGLLYLHERTERYLFRDIKPANIMVRQDGRVKLLDFGCVCSMTEKPDARAGTPGYASPEQLEGKKNLTESCDVYGLGRSLEEMLGRTDPKRHGKKKGKKEKELESILKACTRQNREERISNMRDVRDLFIGLGGDGYSPWRKEALCRKNIWESMYKRT